ncbi:MAG: FAD/NAD(P)-binding protein, partial [Actinomycetes bacterium]
LVAESRRTGRPLEIVLFDPRKATGQGVAYSTTDQRHLLNVPVANMSAHCDQPGHLLSWLHATGWPEAGPDAFVPRCRYGRYLEATLDAAVAAGSGTTVRRVHARVTGLTRTGESLRVHLGGANQVLVDAAVLASGVFPPGTGWAPAELTAHPRFVRDPWAARALDPLVHSDDDVLLVGTGLTMVDVAMTLDRAGRMLHAVSRRGRLPRPHRVRPRPRVRPDLPADPTLDDLRHAVLSQVRAELRAHGDWRPVIDGLRPHVADLWAGLTVEDKARFLTEDAALWDVHRHRMPPDTARAVAAMRRAGRLRVAKGQVTGVDTDRPDHLGVALDDGTTRQVGWVVNCTGPAGDVARVGDTLLDDLLARGLARTGPLGLGLATDDGRLLGVEADLPVWTLGALRRGELWETTAIPEIRVQAADVARRALDRLSIRAARRSRPPRSTPGRPRDLLGLPLSTTAEAAAAFDAGLDKVMRVQYGAEAEFRRAAGLDPGFALAHAALAMLGHEAGADVDVDRAVRDAQESLRRRGDDRERSLVDVVTRRVRDCQGEGARALKRHVRDHPRDALAVSAAVPTIAFSGVTDIQQEAWELVESLAPAYGDDWWYAGLLAFVRQDQGRYDEAADLSGRALAVQPSSGHAVHARTHVHYETGDHTAGLAWLDPWIASNSREASHLAHFSWHAALHELSMGDAAAVRARYASQLAPPYVQGVRALVDSASLLWRCHVTGSWGQPGALPVRAVLDA